MTKTNKKTLEEIIRVDHAGERGAIKIYEGQLLALKTFKQDEFLKKKIEKTVPAYQIPENKKAFDEVYDIIRDSDVGNQKEFGSSLYSIAQLGIGLELKTMAFAFQTNDEINNMTFLIGYCSLFYFRRPVHN